MADELTEEENQLLWKFATEDVTTDELSQIEQLATSNPLFAKQLSELEAQKKEEATRHATAARQKSSWPFWAAVLVILGGIVYWLAV